MSGVVAGNCDRIDSEVDDAV
jgi:hypothetical protein